MRQYRLERLFPKKHLVLRDGLWQSPNAHEILVEDDRVVSLCDRALNGSGDPTRHTGGDAIHQNSMGLGLRGRRGTIRIDLMGREVALDGLRPLWPARAGHTNLGGIEEPVSDIHILSYADSNDAVM